MSDKKKATRQLIAEQWTTYSSFVVPRNASPVQRSECRRAFYAGAWAFYQTALCVVSPGPNVTEDDIRNLGNCVEELEQFYENVKKGER